MAARFRTLALALAALLPAFLPGPSAAQTARKIVTTANSDYFGFDLRSEQNRTLEQCKAICLGDKACRAFTYNPKAKWCFLKSDFRTINAFPGAVAGKVVDVVGDPDIGAAPELAFLPDGMADQARQFRAELLSEDDAGGPEGLATLTQAARQALSTGDPGIAIDNFLAAIKISPDNGTLWLGLARAGLAFTSTDADALNTARQKADAGVWNAYQLSRTAPARAEALTVMAEALDMRDQSRPAMRAYEASLALVSSADVQAAYEDLKARKGFRIVEHTVDADSASPRICAQFSEDLVKTGTDYSTFVSVDDHAPKAIAAEEKQLCVEGLEHGQHYRVAFRAGLPAAIGEVLSAPVTLNVYVRDRAPSIRFTGDSFVLPSTARRGVPLVTVNLDAASVKLYRIGDRNLAQLLSGYQFLRQLDSYEASSLDETQGELVWEGEIEVKNELNKETTTSFPLDQALPARKPGVYVMVAEPPSTGADDYSSKATQWLVVSDIGLSTYAAEDGLTVFTRSLASAKPVSGIELTLIAKNNEILGTATTDAEGSATFNPGLMRATNASAPAALTAKGKDGDFVFLDMTRPGFDLSDRGVAGRPAPGALDIYAWTERGIYRAGETVHAAALARNTAAEAVDDMPLTFIFSRPDGTEDRRAVSDGKALGGHAVDLALEPNAMRGTWSVGLYTDPKKPALATVSFLVEDFVPDRIEFDLSSDKPEVAVGEPANMTVDGHFLYGAPAAGLELEGDVTLSTKRDWARFPGYQFGLADEELGEATRIDLSDLPDVGDDGKATFPVQVDDAPATTRLVNAHVAVRMRETGGRAVERTLDLAVAPETSMIGIKPGFTGEEVPQGATASFDVIAADKNGNRITENGLRWSLVKVDRSYQWYRQNNSWSYEPITTTSVVSNGTISASADSPAKVSVPVDWGRYRLEVETDDPDGPASSVEFDAGWYVAQSSTETPDGLEIALDKPAYKAGETAKLKVSPRFAGELLVTVGADKLLRVQTATVPAGGTTVDIPVGSDWGAGAYVTATLFRPGDAEASRMPARAIGLKWLGVDASARTLSVSLSPPAKTEPRKALAIPVAIGGAQSGEEAYAIVAAVDVGILNLTRYEAPNPEKWFYGQRKLGLEMRDLYGRLIDGSLGVTGRLRTGGDGGGMQAEGNPPTEKLVAFFAGPVKLDADGKATLSFDIPQFNGTARVMAVAWTKTSVGHATTDVIVRDPVVLTAGLPRFLAPGDRASLRLDMTNTDLPAGDFAIAVETAPTLAADDASLPEKIRLEPNKRQSLLVPLTGMAAGDGSVTVRLAGTDGTEVEQTLSLPVRPAAMPVTTRTVANLAPGGGIRVDKELLSASVLDGATVSVGVSLSSALDVPSLLAELDRYPYGCSEQLTSRALPLLYVNELAAVSGMADDPDLKGRVQDTIFRVLNNQSSSGSFGLWGPASGDLWLDAYVTDFLTRAREQGYEVPAQAMLQALDNLQNGLSYDSNLEDRGSQIAYALYVLARNKKASVGDLRYYADTQIEAFKSPLAIGHLAAALALYGDRSRADATFEAAVALSKSGKAGGLERDDYGTPLRDDAAVLALAAESNPLPRVVPELIRTVAAERNAVNYTSTQEQVWMVLAARALRRGNETLSLQVNGQPQTGALSRTLTGEELQQNPITVVNKGTQPVQAVVTAIAAPVDPLPAGGDGFEIERTAYTLDGEPANVTDVKQNERFVVVLKVNELHDWPSRIIVTDLLPAGFEIENPGLVSSASLSNFDWLPETEAAHLEFRDDRFVAAFTQGADSDRSIVLAYVVRAVTPGTYAYPAASVEDMYRPQFSARTATGMMEVKAE